MEGFLETQDFYGVYDGKMVYFKLLERSAEELTQHPVGPHVSYRFVLILGHFKTAISDETI